MGAGAAAYAVVYRQLTEVGSPPGDWLLSLAEFQFVAATDYDCHVVRGAGFVTAKTNTTVRIRGTEVSNDGILEAQIVIRRNLPLWDDIA